MDPGRIQDLLIEQIDCAPQVRERFDSGDGLLESLLEVGLQQPILVRPVGDRYLTIDGERRLRAAKRAGWTNIPAIVEGAELSEAGIVQRQLIANVQRKSLRPVERARAIERLMREAGWTGAQAANRVGLSQASVSKLLALLVLPKDAQELIDAGKLAASAGYEVAKVRDASERAGLLTQAAQGGLTRDKVMRRGTPRRPSSIPDGSRSRERVRRERVVIELGNDRTVTVAAMSLTSAALIEWMEELLHRLRGLKSPVSGTSELAKLLRQQVSSEVRASIAREDDSQ